jgi:hypothetical protein
MSNDLPWLSHREETLRVACPQCGVDHCHIQTVSVCQRGLDVAVARRHVLAIEGPRDTGEYRVELRLFCSGGHRFAVRYVFGGLTTVVQHEALPMTAGLPLLELER